MKSNKHRKGGGKKESAKPFAAKRTMNEPNTGAHQGNTGEAKKFQEHDPKNRLGSFAGTGNHPRTGNRGHE